MQKARSGMFERVLNKQEAIKINFPLNVQCDTEAAICRRSSKLVFLKILEYSQQNTCAGGIFNKVEAPTSAFSCEYYEIFKNSVFYRTPSVAASGNK